MADKAGAVLDLLRSKYHLRVQLSDGQSARLIGPVHRIFLTVGRKEQKFHFGDEDFQDLVTNLAWEQLGMVFDATDMQELKKRMKAITDDHIAAPK
jgi:hypothetical protein